MLLKRFAAGIVAAACLGQTPADLFKKAPPSIDAALRERVSKFYQAHVDGKFRVANEFVAEESKDVFFEADKRRCKTFDVTKVTYNEKFDGAQVLILCETNMLLPPRGLVEVKMPLASSWKIVDGQWFWYVDPALTGQTPFGRMVPGEKGAAAPPAIPTGPSVQDLQKMVTTDRDSLEFPIGSKGEGQVIVKNGLPGIATLTIEPPPSSDFRFKLDKSELKSGESATLFVEYRPDAKRPRTNATKEEVSLRVSPTQSQITIALKLVP